MPIYLGATQLKAYLGATELCDIWLGGVLIDSCDPEVSVSSTSINLVERTFTFATTHFTTNFFTPNAGATHNQVTIKSLPKVTQLTYLGAAVAVGAVFNTANASGLKFELNPRFEIYSSAIYEFDDSVENIIAYYQSIGYKLISNVDGVLTFENKTNTLDKIVVKGFLVSPSALQFTFTTSDTTEKNSNIATLSIVAQGSVNTTPVQNQPPIVGDNTISASRGQEKILTRAMFTTETAPAYSDNENDAPYQLKVVNLPTNGTLMLRGVAMTAGQEIFFIEDIDAQAFKFIPDTNRTVTTVNFDFLISDIGSKTFA